MKTKEGLGDKVENLIKIVLPLTHSRKRDCRKCKKRKEKLNKVGELIWSTKK